MPRLRTIRPNFAQSPSMSRIGREARLLFILLWPIADDAGRLRLIPDQLVEQLFPFDPDASMLLPGWLGELEAAGCIERYGVEGVEYLRIPHWRQLQTIDRPTRSRLPAAPSEPPPAREAREPREESDEMQMDSASSGNPLEEAFFFREPDGAEATQAFTAEEVRGNLRYSLRKAWADDVHTASARFIELMGREAGMWGGHGAPTGRKAQAGDTDEIGMSPAEAHGLPETRQTRR